MMYLQHFYIFTFPLVLSLHEDIIFTRRLLFFVSVLRAPCLDEVTRYLPGHHMCLWASPIHSRGRDLLQRAWHSLKGAAQSR